MEWGSDDTTCRELLNTELASLPGRPIGIGGASTAIHTFTAFSSTGAPFGKLCNNRAINTKSESTHTPPTHKKRQRSTWGFKIYCRVCQVFATERRPHQSKLRYWRPLRIKYSSGFSVGCFTSLFRWISNCTTRRNR